jgi:hypothetical protein
MRPLPRLVPDPSDPSFAESAESESASRKRPESGYPERAEAQRADRVLSAIAGMAARYARLGEIDAARQAADEALSAFADVTNPVALARASLDLGEALIVLGDPTCREILEDAGTLFEDLGDEDGIRRVDTLLRTADASIEQSPRSFHPRRLK